LFAERAVNEPGMRCTRGHFHAGVSETAKGSCSRSDLRWGPASRPGGGRFFEEGNDLID
jgi:hypothetical protein